MHAEVITEKRHVDHDQRVPDRPADHLGVVDHLVHRDRQRVGPTLDDHPQAVADQDRFDAGRVEQSGHGASFGHSLGHGVGLAPHEQPRLAANSGDKLLSGMVFTVEPGIYLSGWGGIRIEDLVVLTDDGPKLLSNAEK